MSEFLCCQDGFTNIFELDEDDENIMMQFFWRRRRVTHRSNITANEDVPELRDVSNYPLLGREWQRTESYNTKSIEHTKLPSKGRVQSKKSKEMKTVSTNKKSSRSISYVRPRSLDVSNDVAAIWMEMGCDATSKKRSRSGFRNYSSNQDQQASQNRIRTVPAATSDVRRAPFQQRGGHSKKQHNVPPPPPYPPHNKALEGSIIKSRPRSYRRMVDWKSAKDPQTGRTYYYNIKTRETQWRKPMELASESERAEMEAKERQQKEFFASMEQNILASMAAGEVTLKSPKPDKLKRDSVLDRPHLVRTISSMEGTVLKDLIKRVPSSRSTKMLRGRENASLKQLGRKYGQRNVLVDIAESSKEMSPEMDFDTSSADLAISADESRALEELAELSEEMAKFSDNNLEENMQMESLDRSSLDNFDFSMTGDLSVSDWNAADAEIKETKSQSVEAEIRKSVGGSMKPALMKRNTCGTLHVNTTMSAPDKDATIKVSPFLGSV